MKRSSQTGSYAQEFFSFTVVFISTIRLNYCEKKIVTQFYGKHCDVLVQLAVVRNLFQSRTNDTVFYTDDLQAPTVNVKSGPKVKRKVKD